MNNLTNTHLLVGLDWADQKHDLAIRAATGTVRFLEVGADPDSIRELIAHLRKLADGRPIAVCLEKSRVRIVFELMQCEDIELYLVDPKQASRFGESEHSSGSKSDPADAASLLRMLIERGDRLRVFRPNDALTRKIHELSRVRRNLVNDRTRLVQQLKSTLKTYYPLLLQIAGPLTLLGRKLLKRYSNPRTLVRAHPGTLREMFGRHFRNDETIDEKIAEVRKPLTITDEALILPQSIAALAQLAQLEVLEKAIKKMDDELKQAMKNHPDANLFEEVPGAGKSMAPRLLAAFGSDRERYRDADELAVISGIAPVTRKSGKTCHVTRRRACSAYLKQTFHEFANCTIRWSPWSGAYYRMQRDRGMKHHAAVRKLARCWIRILFKVWKDRTPYDAERYLQGLQNKKHALLKYMTNPL